MKGMTTTTFRDIVSILIGASGLIHSQLTGMVHIELIVVYGALLGIPGMLSLIEWKQQRNGSSDAQDSE